MDFKTLTIPNRSRLLYISRKDYPQLGEKVKAAPNTIAVLLFKGDATYDEVLASIDTIRSDVEHAKQTHNKREK